MVIKCPKCHQKIFKYLKIGKGRLWHCWKERIIEDSCVRDGDKVKCQYGNIIGIDQGKWIEIKNT